MAKITPFEEHWSQYEAWFEENRYTYESELRAIKEVLPNIGRGLEIGVGSGRFAAPLGIKEGVEPSPKMRELARKRGIFALDGIAEDLPFNDEDFDFALMVTTICFVDDLILSFQEVFRVLKPKGVLVTGFIDRESPIGKIYEKYRDKSVFYADATFYSVEEVTTSMKKAGFKSFDFFQTIFHKLSEIKEPELVKKGYGEGSFVVIKASK